MTDIIKLWVLFGSNMSVFFFFFFRTSPRPHLVLGGYSNCCWFYGKVDGNSKLIEEATCCSRYGGGFSACKPHELGMHISSLTSMLMCDTGFDELCLEYCLVDDSRWSVHRFSWSLNPRNQLIINSELLTLLWINLIAVFGIRSFAWTLHQNAPQPGICVEEINIENVRCVLYWSMSFLPNKKRLFIASHPHHWPLLQVIWSQDPEYGMITVKGVPR